MVTVMYSDYQESGASNLLGYMDKEEGQGLQNSYGEEMSDEEIQAFIDKSERHNFERSMVISPENGDELTDEEMNLYTRETMQEYVEDRPSADYCYAIHRDDRDGDGHDHVHVAVTGEKQDLYMDKQDLNHTREQAHEHYVEQHHEHTPTLEEEHEYERRQQQLEAEREDEQDMGWSL